MQYVENENGFWVMMAFFCSANVAPCTLQLHFYLPSQLSVVHILRVHQFTVQKKKSSLKSLETKYPIVNSASFFVRKTLKNCTNLYLINHKILITTFAAPFFSLSSTLDTDIKIKQCFKRILKNFRNEFVGIYKILIADMGRAASSRVRDDSPDAKSIEMFTLFFHVLFLVKKMGGISAKALPSYKKEEMNKYSWKWESASVSRTRVKSVFFVTYLPSQITIKSLTFST